MTRAQKPQSKADSVARKDSHGPNDSHGMLGNRLNGLLTTTARRLIGLMIMRTGGGIVTRGKSGVVSVGLPMGKCSCPYGPSTLDGMDNRGTIHIAASSKQN